MGQQLKPLILRHRARGARDEAHFFLYTTQQFLGARRHKGNLPALIALHSLLIGTDISPVGINQRIVQI